MVKKIERRFPRRIFYRIISIQSIIVLVALGASGFAARHFFKQQLISQVRHQILNSLTLLSGVIPARADKEWCRMRVRGTELRVTVIDPKGEVLCDSHRDSAGMENHGDRPEIENALRGGFGESIRHSNTIEADMFYGAVAVGSPPQIIRASVPLSFIEHILSVFDTSLFFFLAIVAVLVGAFAVWTARRMVFPIGRLLVKTQSVLEPPSPTAAQEEVAEAEQDPFGEWSDLESDLDRIKKNLEAKTESLSREQVELETIMGAISDAILAVDPDGNPLFYNGRFELLFGNQGLRRKNVKLWDVFREPEILNAFNAALKDGKTSGTKAIPLEGEGLRRYFSMSVSPLRKHDRTVYGAVGVFHDVTDLKSAEQMRIDFVANATHELRTPLTAIKGYTDTLLQDVAAGAPPDPEFLQTIARNTGRLMNLMNDLLDLSSIESIDILHKEQLGTQDFTLRVVKQLQSAFEAKHHRIHCDFRTPKVLADPNRLEQVLVNLLDNANKYSPADGEISVVWENDGNDVVLKVGNPGPGIPIEHHARLFERFYRVDKARSRDQGGTGLGLAIVKHIMQRHEGTINVESRPGQGATFICRFPQQDNVRS